VRITILHNDVPPDAPPDERDVLDQAAAIGGALDELGHRATPLPVGLDLEQLKRNLEAERPDCVFNLVESLDGDDRGILFVPALLERLGVPYTGAPIGAVLMTTNKIVAKRLLRDASLPTPAWYAAGDPEDEADRLAPGRVIVKPVWDHGSRALDEDDVVAVESGKELRALVESRSASGERFAERYVAGREFNLALLAGPGDRVEVLPPAEMQFRGWEADRPRVVGFRAKWVPESFEYANTVRRFDFDEADRPLLRRLEALARECWRSFGLRGYARVDFRVADNDKPWILEANVNPCLAPDAGFAAALERAGTPFAAAVERIVDNAMRAVARAS
jgi:D-alanine-D-alanine ligase